jgi:hypothetical protein
MSWSYSGNPGSSSLDEVRFLIGDTDTSDQLLSNEELNWIIAQEPDTYSAAITAVVRLISQASREAQISKSVGDLSISRNNGQKVTQWESLLSQLRAERVNKYVVAPVVNSNAIVRTIDKDADDVAGTDFALGQMDNN